MKYARLAGMLLLLVGCNVWKPVLQKGFCDTTADCAAGLVCEADRCAAPGIGDGSMDTGFDVGAGGQPGGDAGTDLLSDVGGMDVPPPKCVSAASCTVATKPICDEASGACSACATNAQCSATIGSSSPFCDVESGRCVACLKHGQCGEGSPICSGGACIACNDVAAMAGACTARDTTKGVCAVSGKCVECAVSGDCKGTTKPICSENMCRSCGIDSECVAKLGADPGVCMAHDDGRCATAAETVFVENAAGKCASGAGPGSAAMPFCGLQDGINSAKGGGKALVVLRGPKAVDRAAVAGPGKLGIVGQVGALVRGGAGPGLSVTGGEAYVRALVVEASDPGVKVSGAGKLTVEGCIFRDNPGGGVLLDGGTLVMRNSTVSGNGPGQFGLATWGGVILNNPTASTQLDRVSIINNKNTGISCSASVMTMGVLVNANVGVDIAPACSFVSCGSASAACGGGQ